MEWLKIILEYLKTLLSTQMVAGAICLVFFCFFKEDIKALMFRIAKIRLPGGGELSTPQLKEQIKEKTTNQDPPPAPETDDANIPTTLDQQELETIKNLLGAERARAYLWEYRYLNYYLVHNTQRVLNWLASNKELSSLSFLHTFWTPLIPDPNEREAIISVLQNHYLIIVENDLITVSPKGHEYINWRGPITGETS